MSSCSLMYAFERNLSFILFLVIPFEVVNSGVTRGILRNSVFHNFDLKCLPSETISGLIYKKYVSANRTTDLELRLLCRRIAGPWDPVPMVNESTCRYGDKFRLYLNGTLATNSSNNTNCIPGEYISGFRGVFEKGYRMLRLRCCKAINSQPIDDMIGCRTIGPQDVSAVAMAGLRDPAPLRRGCPRDVLSSFSVVRGRLTVKFCPLALDGAEYESYCIAQRSQLREVSNDEETVNGTTVKA